MLQNNKHIIYILTLFLISVGIRVPNLNRPLSYHHEFVTAHVLRILEIWNEEGISKSNYNPKVNYKGEENKFIKNQGTDLVDKEGNYYYLSYPPFGYYLPYFIAQLTRQNISVSFLQIFNMALHLIGCIIIALILRLFTFSKDILNKTVLVAASFYFLAPGPLWFHSNTYMVDMLSEVLLLIQVYILSLIIVRRKTNIVLLLSLFAITFFHCYTEWLGYFVSLSCIGILLSRYRTLDARKNIIIGISMASLIALSLTLYQYASIGGVDAFIETANNKLQQRTGWNQLTDSLGSYLLNFVQIGINYGTSYLPIILLLLGLLIMSFIRNRFITPAPFSPDSYREEGSTTLKVLLILTVLPITLHHMVFSNFSGHDFAVLKSAGILSIIVSFLLVHYVKQSRLLAVITIIIGICNVSIYYFINRPGEVSFRGKSYDHYLKQGSYINQIVQKDEVVFLKGGDLSPQVVYYAKRNIKKVESIADARQYLIEVSLDKGVLFYLDNSHMDYERIRIVDNTSK